MADVFFYIIVFGLQKMAPQKQLLCSINALHLFQTCVQSSLTIASHSTLNLNPDAAESMQDTSTKLGVWCLAQGHLGTETWTNVAWTCILH